LEDFAWAFDLVIVKVIILAMRFAESQWMHEEPSE
jgi:hypothetical protein